MCVINWWRDEPSACRYSAVETHKIYVKNVRTRKNCSPWKHILEFPKSKCGAKKRDHRWLTVAIHFHFRLPLFSFGVAAREMCFMKKHREGDECLLLIFHRRTQQLARDSTQSIFSSFLSTRSTMKMPKIFFHIFHTRARWICVSRLFFLFHEEICKESQLVLSSREIEAHPVYELCCGWQSAMYF